MTTPYSVGDRVRYRSPRPPYQTQEGIVLTVLSPGYAVRPINPRLRDAYFDAPDDVIALGDILPPPLAFVKGDHIRSTRSGRSGYVTEVLDGAYIIEVTADNYLTDRSASEYFISGRAMIAATNAASGEHKKSVIAPGMEVRIAGNPKNDQHVGKRGVTIRKAHSAGHWFVAVIDVGEIVIDGARLVVQKQGVSS